MCVAWILKSGRLSSPQDGTHAYFLKRDILVCFTCCQRVCEKNLKYWKKYHQGVTFLEESITATWHFIRKLNHNADDLIEIIPFKNITTAYNELKLDVITINHFSKKKTSRTFTMRGDVWLNIQR